MQLPNAPPLLSGSFGHKMGLPNALPPHLSVALVVAAFPSGALRSSPPTEPLPDLLIGYTEFRTDLPGGPGHAAMWAHWQPMANKP